jgi:serine/threonine protein kinase
VKRKDLVRHQKTQKYFDLIEVKMDSEDDFSVREDSKDDAPFPSLCNPYIACAIPVMQQQPLKVAYYVQPHKETFTFYEYLQRATRLPVDHARVYLAEVAVVLHTLHSHSLTLLRDFRGVFLTDLLQINFETGHIHFDDLRVHKKRYVDYSENPAYEYEAPETLMGCGAPNAASDWWVLGNLLYEMITGLPPFHSDTGNVSELYELILTKPLSFHDDASLFHVEARDLCRCLLQRDPTQRLRSLAALQEHPFMQNIDWEAIKQGKGSDIPIQWGF